MSNKVTFAWHVDEGMRNSFGDLVENGFLEVISIKTLRLGIGLGLGLATGV